MPVLQFKGKSVIESYHHTVPHHRLEFDKKLSVLGKGEQPGLDGNLIIEGDNLIALKALLPTHAGKVKCIYIDPPYNTGNEGWVYNDNLTQPQFKEWVGKTVGKEGEDGCRHDKWCCMMYPRLVLLRELLAENGAIFISIDDNEFHRLRQLLDEVFGVEGFVGVFVWQKRYSRDNRPALNAVHDYIVVYSHDEETFKKHRNFLTPEESQLRVYRNPNRDPLGRWRPIPMTAQGTRPNQMYEITTPTGVVHRPPAGRCWSMIESEYKKLLADGTNVGDSKRGRIWFGADGNSQPNVIRYMSEIEGFVPWTWLPHDEAGHTDEAKKEVYDIIGTEVATTPKPVRLLRRLLEIYTDPDSNELVLDSFGGTGTTAHAVLSLNALDEGNRRFVLIQQPFDTSENKEDKFNICQNVTAERVKRAILGYSFTGTVDETLYEEKLTLSKLKKAQEILETIERVRSEEAKKFDEVVAECSEGIVRVTGRKSIKDKVDGLGGSFSYVRLGEPLFSEYKDWGETPPSFSDLARYVFYTETSRECDPKKFDEATGFIGSTAAAGGTSYYLLYTPNGRDDRELSLKTLADLVKRDKNRSWVIYCEKFWMHDDELRKFEREHGKRIRPMLVPFNLR